MYTLTDDPNVVIRDSDGAVIKLGTPGWSNYKNWRFFGNSPNPAKPPPPPAPVIPLSMRALTLSNIKLLVAAGRTDEAISTLVSLLEAP